MAALKKAVYAWSHDNSPSPKKTKKKKRDKYGRRDRAEELDDSEMSFFSTLSEETTPPAKVTSTALPKINIYALTSVRSSTAASETSTCTTAREWRSFLKTRQKSDNPGSPNSSRSPQKSLSAREIRTSHSKPIRRYIEEDKSQLHEIQQVKQELQKEIDQEHKEQQEREKFARQLKEKLERQKQQEQLQAQLSPYKISVSHFGETSPATTISVDKSPEVPNISLTSPETPIDMASESASRRSSNGPASRRSSLYPFSRKVSVASSRASIASSLFDKTSPLSSTEKPTKKSNRAPSPYSVFDKMYNKPDNETSGFEPFPKSPLKQSRGKYVDEPELSKDERNKMFTDRYKKRWARLDTRQNKLYTHVRDLAYTWQRRTRMQEATRMPATPEEDKEEAKAGYAKESKLFAEWFDSDSLSLSVAATYDPKKKFVKLALPKINLNEIHRARHFSTNVTY